MTMSFSGLATPAGAAGGVLSGTYPNPGLAANQNIAGNMTVGGHLISSAAAAPITSNLGANVTSAVPAGNDVAGSIAITMSGALGANTRACTVTFAAAYASAPKITLVDQTSAVGITIVNSYVQAQNGGISYDIAFDQALGAGVYNVDYIVIG